MWMFWSALGKKKRKIQNCSMWMEIMTLYKTPYKKKERCQSFVSQSELSQPRFSWQMRNTSWAQHKQTVVVKHSFFRVRYRKKKTKRVLQDYSVKLHPLWLKWRQRGFKNKTDHLNYSKRFRIRRKEKKPQECQRANFMRLWQKNAARQTLLCKHRALQWI